MQKGMELARTLLIEIRDTNPSAERVAELIDARLPGLPPSRLGFLIVLGSYLRGALSGAPVDPEHL